MLKQTLLAFALILSGAGCTTVQPLTPFPTPPEALLVACERPRALPEGSASPTAADALATVTANYARHHRCGDRLDALQEWVRGQVGVR
jgi:hypothetical protein